MPFFNSLIREFFDLDASIRSMPVECTTVSKAYQTNTMMDNPRGGTVQMQTVALTRTQTFRY